MSFLSVLRIQLYLQGAFFREDSSGWYRQCLFTVVDVLIWLGWRERVREKETETERNRQTQRQISGMGHTLLRSLQASSSCFTVKSTKHCQWIWNKYFCIFPPSFVFSDNYLQPPKSTVVDHIARWPRRSSEIFLWTSGGFWAFLLMPSIRT